MLYFLYFMLLSIPVLAAIAFFWFIYQLSKDRAVERHNRLYRFHPDSNGNYDIYHDLSESSFAPTPGNAPFNPTIIHSNGVTREITRQPRPMVFNNYRLGNRQPEIEAEEVSEVSEVSEIELETAPKLLSQPEISEYIRQCKLEGKGMVASAKVLHIKPGDNPAYINFRTMWSNENGR